MNNLEFLKTWKMKIPSTKFVFKASGSGESEIRPTPPPPPCMYFLLPDIPYFVCGPCRLSTPSSPTSLWLIDWLLGSCTVLGKTGVFKHFSQRRDNNNNNKNNNSNNNNIFFKFVEKWTYFIDNSAYYSVKSDSQLIHSKKLFLQTTVYKSFRLKKPLS